VGDTLEEVKKNIREAVIMQGMIEHNEPIPQPQSTAKCIDIAIPELTL